MIKTAGLGNLAFLRTTGTIVFAATLILGGCDTIRLLERQDISEQDIPEGAEVAAAPWPRLIDTPTAPPLGAYTAATPDPAEGVAIQVGLAAAGAAARAEAQRVADPVLTPDERAAFKEATQAAAALRGAQVD